MCGNAISHVTVEACLDSSCTSTNGTVSMLPDGERRVMATFTDLMENRKYTAVESQNNLLLLNYILPKYMRLSL